MMSFRQNGIVYLALALVFTIGLTFASVELPYIIDGYLQDLIRTPGDDSHATPAHLYRTELFIDYYHLRLVGYLCFGLTVLLIILGFATRNSGIVALGAIAFMLPVFAQFAYVMFFLAGLGLLNVFWLPVLDLATGAEALAGIVRAPYDVAQWLFREAGAHAFWPMVLCCIGSGLLLFFLGTFAWLSARARGANVADFWVYRFSRHPQYLGWILWTYGLFLLLMRGHYPKRSWGIDAGLPWLISTIVIIGVAMLEELNMQRRFGDSYREYRQKAPFLFPLPRALTRILTSPFRVVFKKERPERVHEVILVLALSFVLLGGASVLLYGGVASGILALGESPDGRRERIEARVRALTASPNWRERSAIARSLVTYGEPAVPFFCDLLRNENPDIRAEAAERLGDLQSATAVPFLLAALNDSDANVRHRAIRSLGALGAPEAGAPILALAESPDRTTRRIAGSALAHLKVEGALKVLTKQLRDSLVWTRVGAAEDLGALGSEDAVPRLVQQLDDGFPIVRRAVVVALARIGSATALPALREAQKDDDWEVRIYAEEAVRRITSSPEGSKEN